MIKDSQTLLGESWTWDGNATTASIPNSEKSNTAGLGQVFRFGGGLIEACFFVDVALGL